MDARPDHVPRPGRGARFNSHRDTDRQRFERAAADALHEADIDLAHSSPLVLAVSGGADSTALLLAVHALAERLRAAAALLACYVDHGLRPAGEVAVERDAVAELCRPLQVSFVCRAVDVAAHRKAARLSWEAAARECRYAALAEVARDAGAAALLTGHIADDQVETVLLRLLRGTGPRGLRGMAVTSRPWGPAGPALVRPLLALRRVDTEAYCRARGARWCEDRTNRSPRFLRNRVRHELVPMMRSLSPGTTAAVQRLAEQAAALDRWLRSAVDEQMARLCTSDGEDLRLRRSETPLDPFLAGEVVAAVLAKLYGEQVPSAHHVQSVARLWREAAGAVELPRGWRAEATERGIRFTQEALSAPVDWLVGRWPLHIGVNDIPGWRVQVTCVARDETVREESAFEAFVVQPDAAPPDLSAGFWTPGERLRPAGMTGSRKLQDIFTDAKIARAERRRVPLLYRGDECVWAVGVKRAAAAPPRYHGASPALHIRFTPAPSNGI